MLRDMIQHSYLIFVANVTILLFIIFNSTLPKRRKLPFLIGGCMSLAMIACNYVVYTFQGSAEHQNLLLFFDALSYSISGPVILPYIFLSSVISRRIRRILLILAGTNAVLCFLSIFTGWVFYCDAGGYIKLGQLAPIPFGLCAAYLAVLLTVSWKKFRLGMHGESLFIIFISVGIIIATILNTFYHYLFLISGMSVLACVFYYLFFISQTLTRDALTNALNRHSFYKDIERMKRRHLFLISVDLNGLKQLNDTKGHSAGDKAILTVAEVAMEILPLRCRLYRMGGDEYEILFPSASEDEIVEFNAKFKAGVQRRGYSIAIGYSEYDKYKSFDEAFKIADARMYENKKQMKAVRQN